MQIEEIFSHGEIVAKYTAKKVTVLTREPRSAAYRAIMRGILVRGKR